MWVFPKLLHHWLVGFPPRDTGAAGFEAVSHLREGDTVLVVGEHKSRAAQFLALFAQRRVLSELLGSPLDQPPGFGLLHEPLHEVRAASQRLRCLPQGFRVPSDGRGHDLLVRFELLARILQGPSAARHGLEDELLVRLELLSRIPQGRPVGRHGLEDELLVPLELLGRILQGKTVGCHGLEDDLLVRFELSGHLLQGQPVGCHGPQDEGAVATQMLCFFPRVIVTFSKRSQDLLLLLHGVGRWELPRGKGLSSLKQSSFRRRLSILGLKAVSRTLGEVVLHTSILASCGFGIWTLRTNSQKKSSRGALNFGRFRALEGMLHLKAQPMLKKHFRKNSDPADAKRAFAAQLRAEAFRTLLQRMCSSTSVQDLQEDEQQERGLQANFVRSDRRRRMGTHAEFRQEQS